MISAVTLRLPTDLMWVVYVDWVITPEMMHAKVHRFLPVPSNKWSIDQWPNIKSAMLQGVDLDVPIRAGQSAISFTVEEGIERRRIIIHYYPKYYPVDCVYSWVPKQLPTQYDAEFVVNMRRAKEMFRDRPDNAFLDDQMPRFRIYPRLYKWYEVFWQVALMPLCDDLKRILVYCLIDV